MSKYEWESGRIKLPGALWSSFRTELLKAWNKAQECVLKDARVALKAAKLAVKGKRGSAREKALTEALEAHCTKRVRMFRGYQDELDYDLMEAIEGLIVARPSGQFRGPFNLQAPKKKDLDLKAVSKSAVLHLGEASIGFDNKSKTVSWEVHENNRACERAREYPMAKALFKALGKVEWTKGSGGQIVGNDEYNRDSYDGLGGGNYVVAAYSQEQQKRDRKSRGRYRRW